MWFRNSRQELEGDAYGRATSSSSAGVHIKTEPVHKVSGKSASTSEGGARVTCRHCGKPGHLATVCRFRDSVCHKCKKKGHLVRVCRSKSQPQPTPQGRPKRVTSNSQPVCRVDEESDIDSDDSMLLIMTVKQRQDGHTHPIKVHVEVEKISIPMELDTGASVSIMSENRYHKFWPRRGLSTSAIRLNTYSKEPITVVGIIL